MKAKVVKIQSQVSRYGGLFYYVFLKNDEGSYKTCLYPQYGNFERWREVVQGFRQDREMWLDGLVIRRGSLIDADSKFKILQEVA